MREKLERTLRMRDLVVICVGAVIGSGIFIVPATVLRQTGGEPNVATTQRGRPGDKSRRVFVSLGQASASAALAVRAHSPSTAAPTKIAPSAA